jgi:flagellum-specific peptidoglycan hydrolase FlgJ
MGYTVEGFVKRIAPIVVAECKARGYKFPSAIIAQAILESRSGNSLLAAKYHNYFGMKCGSSWEGKSVNMATKEEYKPGTLTDIRANFRVYDSIEDGVKGYFDFISTKRYENLKYAISSRNYIELIKVDGYATSNTYINNVYAMVEKYGLTFYDIDNMEVVPVEKEIFDIDQAARDVIKGKYGNGEERKKKLGVYYTEVQKRVNELLKK